MGWIGKLIVAVLLLSFPGTAASKEKIQICGTGDSQELLRKLGGAFEKTVSDVAIVVPDSVGSDGGIKAVVSGECDLARVARPLKDEERSLNLTYKLFAFSPVVIVADPAVGIEDLTAEQIVDIFSGKIKQWSVVGGKGGAINVVNREAKDSSRGELNLHLKGFKAVTNPVGVTALKTPEAVELLLKTPHVIGYLPMAMAKSTILKIVKINGIAPSAANVVQEKYNIAVPFGLVWKGSLKDTAQRFLQFIKGAEGRKIIIDSGIVPSDLL